MNLTLQGQVAGFPKWDGKKNLHLCSLMWECLPPHCSCGTEHAAYLSASSKMEARCLEHAYSAQDRKPLGSGVVRTPCPQPGSLTSHNSDLHSLLKEESLFWALDTCYVTCLLRGCHSEWKQSHNWEVAGESLESPFFLRPAHQSTTCRRAAITQIKPGFGRLFPSLHR